MDGWMDKMDGWMDKMDGWMDEIVSKPNSLCTLIS
jgi:hypothetical protein